MDHKFDYSYGLTSLMKYYKFTGHERRSWILGWFEFDSSVMKRTCSWRDSYQKPMNEKYKMVYKKSSSNNTLQQHQLFSMKNGLRAIAHAIDSSKFSKSESKKLKSQKMKK